ncbi:sigma-70 family RNA polymerase sigma factor [Microbacterium sp. W1N]|uniref:RNA polymerase sigma factor n=1 Tax=Microbacterium festucae TaxID=2977531 RepID=UPI0021C0C680|nr:sigma-70 family RNA polymerase sigma factor [Microbacterium festucae]MCT9819146.1 sigma-70 family RNA polymerase sigma factor [Microbacterium festucae]
MSDVDPTPADPAPGDVGPIRAPGIWEQASDSFARWRDGDTRAMDDLVRLMTPVLWHVVRAYGLERMLAEDVVQSTWLTLVRRADGIHDPRAVAGWLTTTARREAWRAGRAQQRLRPVDEVDLEPQLPVAASAEDTAQLSLRDERLWSAVATLEERCRRLLRIVAFEERPDYARIAQDLSMPVGSIGPTRQRCLGKLRTALLPPAGAGDRKGDSHDF